MHAKIDAAKVQDDPLCFKFEGENVDTNYQNTQYFR